MTRALGFSLVALVFLQSCLEPPRPLESRFPAIASRIEQRLNIRSRGDGLRAATTGPLELGLPVSGTDPVMLSLTGLPRVELRELGLTGFARSEQGGVVYETARGRSYWFATRAGYEEFIEVVDATEAPVAEWEIRGATLQSVEDGVMLVDDAGLGRVHVTAPAAWDSEGRPGRAWLEVRGERLALFTELRGHVLVDPLWTAATALPSEAVRNPTVTLLKDGRLLVAGGEVSTGASQSVAIYEPSSGAWTPAAPLQLFRRGHAATLLKSGEVLVTGGEDGAGTIQSQAEVFDPATGAWTLLTGGGGRFRHTATLLTDGRVLIAGGVNSVAAATPALTTTALFDPGTRLFTTGPALTAGRADHRAVRLQDGRVVVISGVTTVAGNATRTANEVFSGSAWTAFPSITQGRKDFSATVLPSGELLVAGGFDATGRPLLSCELWRPSSNTWAATGSLTTARGAHVASLVTDGRVLIAGGISDAGVLSSAELFNPDAGAWAAGGTLAASRAGASAAMLPNGKVLVVGGADGAGNPLLSAELYDRAFAGGVVLAGTPLAAAHRQGAVVLLPSGQVLVTGGRNGVGTPLGATWLFQPDAGTWAPAGALGTARFDFGATLLSTGEVLVAGGSDGGAALNSAELFNPSTATWRYTGSLAAPRQQLTLTPRLDGTAVAIGGLAGSTLSATAELYRPELGTWTSIANPVPRRQHTATINYLGDVVVAGGLGADAGALTSVYRFDSTGAWAVNGSLLGGRGLQSSTLLRDGRVLLIGGGVESNSASTSTYYCAPGGTTVGGPAMPAGRGETSTALLPNGKIAVFGGFDGTALVQPTLLFEPALGAAGTWNSGPNLSPARARPGLAQLRSGLVLAVGGSVDGGAVSGARLFDEDRGARAAWTPAISSVSPSVATPDGGLTITGTSFEGVSEGGRGDHFSARVPLLELRGLESDRRYELLPLTWTATTITTVVPASIPTGLYFLTVTVNGVRSEAVLLEYFVPVLISPVAVTRPPRGTLTFGADGGTGNFGWSFVTNASGGSLMNGTYRAGDAGSVTDVVRVFDRKGRQATATITVTAGLSASPATTLVPPRGTQSFTAAGGSGSGNTWSVLPNNSGATIGSGGLYTAGLLGGVIDVVRVVDDLGNEGTVAVTVSAGVAVSPGSASGSPSSTRTFTASGGSGTGFTWTLSSNNSGGSVDGGVYRAGTVGNVIDTLQATDSLGNFATAQFSVGAGVSIMPSSASTPPLGSVSFTASGGSGTGYAWAFVTNASNGSVSAAGAYTAGPTQGFDTVRVTDSLGNTATVVIDVTTALRATPSTTTVPPRFTVNLSASGGSGTGFTWTLITNGSGATLPAGTSMYTAGVTGGLGPDGGLVTDEVRVTDSLGASALAMIFVSEGVRLTPAAAAVPPLGARLFLAQGGSAQNFTWSLMASPSGGSVDGGAYVAGATGSVTDVLLATDSLGNTATANITVTPGLTIDPASPVAPPNGTIDFLADGGAGVGYVWTLTSAPSGGVINRDTGAYRAGPTGGTVDQLRVVDLLGNVATTSITVADAPVVMPQSPSVAPGGTITFSAQGGTGMGFSWRLATNASGGTIDAMTGAYRAGSTGGVLDRVEVRDSLMNPGFTDVNVTAALTVQPSTANVPPRGSLAFTPSGGAPPYVFDLVAGGSGGSIDVVTGVYTAGATGLVSDVVGVTDSTNTRVTAQITVTAGLDITPPSAMVAPSASQQFTVTGGSGTGFVWELSTNGSGGTIDPMTGAYVAGPDDTDDVVLVRDSLDNTAIANVRVQPVGPIVDQTPFSQRPPVSGWSCGCGATGSEAGLFTLLGLGLLGWRARRRVMAPAMVAALLLAAGSADAAAKKVKGKRPPSTPSTPDVPTTPVAQPEPEPKVSEPTPEPVVAQPPVAPVKDPNAKQTVTVLDVELTVPDEKLDGPAFTEVVVNSLEGTGLLKVISARDVVTMLGLERQKQLIGACTNDSSGCVSDLAGALGADLVFATSIGKAGDAYVVSARLFEGRESRVVGRGTLQAENANALLAAVWKASQQALVDYTKSLPAKQSQRWSSRPPQEPPAAVLASATPNWFGVTVLAVGGLQVLSEAGRVGSIGGEVDLTFRRGRFDLTAGVIIAPSPGARFSVAWALIDSRFRLGLALRGTAYPGLVLFGGGLGVTAEFAFTRHFGVFGTGAGELYPARGGVVVAALGALGVSARF